MRGVCVMKSTSRKRLVKTFVNAVYLYDDKITLAFNFTDSCEKPEIIELADIADGVVEKFVHRASCSTKTRTYELNVRLIKMCFVMTVERPVG